jgi:hypothetical protein
MLPHFLLSPLQFEHRLKTLKEKSRTPDATVTSVGTSVQAVDTYQRMVSKMKELKVADSGEYPPRGAPSWNIIGRQLSLVR